MKGFAVFPLPAVHLHFFVLKPLPCPLDSQTLPAWQPVPRVQVDDRPGEQDPPSSKV